ncbi:hypothetical protein QTO34_010392 [Cnephaeus nilssonii]|uniref:Galectin n=1 Tax=Cnephaeus nilssonii TaxID=3371016 RepID=A0AA40HFD3_CNENI|nr:hypothetical protein QTO34_010392 [Eptesicus nilssonii]
MSVVPVSSPSQSFLCPHNNNKTTTQQRVLTVMRWGGGGPQSLSFDVYPALPLGGRRGDHTWLCPSHPLSSPMAGPIHKTYILEHWFFSDNQGTPAMSFIMRPELQVDFHTGTQEDSDIAFCFRVYFGNYVVMNSRQFGDWKSEEKYEGMPFVDGQAFELCISVLQNEYQVSVPRSIHYMGPKGSRGGHSSPWPGPRVTCGSSPAPLITQHPLRVLPGSGQDQHTCLILHGGKCPPSSLAAMFSICAIILSCEDDPGVERCLPDFSECPVEKDVTRIPTVKEIPPPK